MAKRNPQQQRQPDMKTVTFRRVKNAEQRLKAAEQKRARREHAVLRADSQWRRLAKAAEAADRKLLAAKTVAEKALDQLLDREERLRDGDAAYRRLADIVEALRNEVGHLGDHPEQEEE